VADPRPGRDLVYLVPGFFGFEKLGPFEYFVHVQAILRAHLDPGWEIRVVPTPPTASLTERTRVLIDTIDATAGDEDRLHLIGHSSGGLDVRLVTTPAAHFDPRASKIAARVRSVVTVATPHRGTPLAAAFDGVIGKQLLALTTRAAAGGLKRTTRGGPLIEYLAMISRDQGLLTQLTPDALDVFNATTPDAPNVRYGCVVAMTPGRPQHPLYGALRRLSARMPQNRAATLPGAAREALERAGAAAPTWKDSDGIVPTRSQVWGEIVHAAAADHLDVLGHYDWLRSGAPFGPTELETLWTHVAQFVHGDALEPPLAPTPPGPSLLMRHRRRMAFAAAMLFAFVVTQPLVFALGLDRWPYTDVLTFSVVAAALALAVERWV